MKDVFTFNIPAAIDDVVAAYKTTEFFLATLKHAGAITIDILDEGALPDEGHYWKAKITESTRVPEFLRASDLDIYINESAFDPSAGKLSWKIKPNFSAGRFNLNGDIAMSALEDTTQLLYRVNLHSKIPLVRSTAERIGLKKIGEEFKKQADFLTSWVAEKRATSN